MTGLITSIVGLAIETLRFVSEKKKTEFQQRLFDLQTDLLNEEKKEVSDQDDAKIEMLHKQIMLVLDAIKLQLQLKVTDEK